MIKFKKALLLKEDLPSSPHQLSFSDIEHYNEEEEVQNYFDVYNDVMSTGNYAQYYERMAKIQNTVPEFLGALRKSVQQVSGGNTVKAWRGLALYQNTQGYDEFVNLNIGDQVILKSFNKRVVFSWTAYVNRAMRFAVKSMSQKNADLSVVIESQIPVDQILMADRAISKDAAQELADEWGFGSIPHYHFEDELIVWHAKPIYGILVYHTKDKEKSNEFLSKIPKTKWDPW